LVVNKLTAYMHHLITKKIAFKNLNIILSFSCRRV